MSTRRYTLPVGQTQWEVPSGNTTIFNWEYDDGRDRLLTLYEKGKEKQWNAQTRLDWSIDVEPGGPDNIPDYYIPIYGSDMWDALDERQREELRHHMGSWMNSQFLHGEQGALICASKIVQTVPDVDSKFYAATQVMDEARHVEMYAKYVNEKLELAYPINPNLKALLNDVIADERWDMTYLGMQVVIEGLALAAFSLIRDFAEEPLAKAINTYVMQDEARHVEMYAQYVNDKLELAYPINENLKALLNDVIADERWDMTYLGMQVVIEGLALAAFSLIRDFAEEPLAKAINTYVMQDEARHVAFGRLALKDYYPQLTQTERDEREEFVVQACYLMRDRFQAQEVWERLGLDVDACLKFVQDSQMMQEFRKMLFSRIVPTVKDIGLWGPKIRKAYEDMGVLQFQDMDPDSLQAQDEELARTLDGSKTLSEEAEASASLAGVDPGRALEVQETIRMGAREDEPG